MAHRTKSGISIQSGPRKILERPSLAALLGTVSAEWALIENRVMTLYAYLMGIYLPRTSGFNPPIHPVALQVFDTLETQRLRMELLKKLAKWLIKDTALLSELNESVIKAIKKAGKLRNTLVHAHWGIAKEYPDALILLPTFGHKMVYKESDFNEAIDRITDACSVVGKFDLKVRKLLGGKSNC